MLTALVIRDLALIEEVEVELSAGLNALTGETGAGTSLFVGALECLRGETPRRGAEQARVEGHFERADDGVRARVVECLRAELPELAETLADPRELVLGRTLGADGRTRAHVDQRPVPLRALGKLASLVLEIHG